MKEPQPLTLEQAVQALFTSGKLPAEQVLTWEDVKFLETAAELARVWFERYK